MTHLLAIDPGKLSGYAIIEYNSEAKSFSLETLGESDTKNIQGVYDALNTFSTLYSLKKIVIENYRIRPAQPGKYNHTWDDTWTLQVIGAIKYWALENDFEVIMQEPAIKPLGAGPLGIPYTPGKKGTHAFDAAIHGGYYFMQQGYPVKGVDFRTPKNKRKMSEYRKYS